MVNVEVKMTKYGYYCLLAKEFKLEPIQYVDFKTLYKGGSVRGFIKTMHGI